MGLLREIIAEAVSDDVRLATLLRKCLVLAEELANEGLRSWATFELNGYPDRNNLPTYRIAAVTAKGLLLGPFGTQVKGQPLAASILKEEHRRWATTAYLNEPITSYERLASSTDNDGRIIIYWPADLTLYYQSEFYEDFVLNRAWQEIPTGAIAAVVDTVRTRLLQFALEIQRELSGSDDAEAAVEPAKVEWAVQTIIYGGTNIVGSTVTGDVQLTGQQLVIEGDFSSLAESLRKAGVEREYIADLERAICDDQADGTEKGFGSRVAGWLKKSGTYVGKEGAKAASATASKAVTAAVLAYFGISV
jgi:hypothetical protein